MRTLTGSDNFASSLSLVKAWPDPDPDLTRVHQVFEAQHRCSVCTARLACMRCIVDAAHYALGGQAVQ